MTTSDSDINVYYSSSVKKQLAILITDAWNSVDTHQHIIHISK